MKTIRIERRGQSVTIVAPTDKEMAVDQNALQQGILSIGEFGTSGIKVAAFHDWDEVWFGAEAAGYKISEEAPF